MWGQIAMALGQTLLSKNASDKAASGQQGILNSALGELDAGKDQALSYMSPFLQASQSMTGQLTGMLNGDTSYLNNGALGVVQEQAADRVETSQAALGRTGAGETPGMIARAMAEPALNYEQNRLSNLQNIYNSGTNVAGQMGNIVSNTATNKANVLTGQTNMSGKGKGILADGMGDLAGILSNSGIF